MSTKATMSGRAQVRRSDRNRPSRLQNSKCSTKSSEGIVKMLKDMVQGHRVEPRGLEVMIGESTLMDIESSSAYARKASS